LVAIIAIAVQIATSHPTTNITQHFHGPVNGNDVSVVQKKTLRRGSFDQSV
jgi:hypothetical protein